MEQEFLQALQKYIPWSKYLAKEWEESGSQDCWDRNSEQLDEYPEGEESCKRTYGELHANASCIAQKAVDKLETNYHSSYHGALREGTVKNLISLSGKGGNSAARWPNLPWIHIDSFEPIKIIPPKTSAILTDSND
ncbi:hypothetical protein L6452_17971 [Arctium lappa]|uniref:Uncharacterized protein n=1 Tax=Arctium lappa TaxID=4217 RepID=A0ACB9C4S5_ARCLA|nr:hypothetical protein L6452_17971 [Arctium lappa]